jgi:hypothetical protein
MTLNDELESGLKEAVVAYLKYYPRTFWDGLRKTTKNFNQDNLSLGPTEYEQGLYSFK